MVEGRVYRNMKRGGADSTVCREKGRLVLTAGSASKKCFS